MAIESYWPKAITKDGAELFTYDSTFTKEQALNQFDIWENSYGYQIKEAWITDADGKRIDVKKRWQEVNANADQ